MDRLGEGVLHRIAGSLGVTEDPARNPPEHR
jgi:hypothetical protein